MRVAPNLAAAMQARLSFITLGVADLERSRRFYTEVLGWRPLHDADGIVMYRLNGMILSLFPQHELAADALVKDEGRGARFTLAQCLLSVEEVDALFAELKQQGVTITKEPVKVFWGGYSGYFADPDGHLWEIAHNPFLEMDAAGNVVGMKM
jgi:catechol 2,3-dioxygenase-like lactoylglutathione lyase family enzyme